MKRKTRDRITRVQWETNLTMQSLEPLERKCPTW